MRTLVNVMGDVDLQFFVTTFNTELRRFHPEWESRIDSGAKRTIAQLWANGYLLRLDLTENHLEPAEPGKESRKYDQIRMLIFENPREPMEEVTWRGGSSETVATRFWQSVKHGGDTSWRDEVGAEMTIEQVFSGVRAELTRAIEEGNR